jgi:hypothetical protein
MAKKSVPAKKVVKKAAPAAAKKSPSNGKVKKLQDELAKLAKEINEEGLSILIQQAKTIVSNIKLDKLKGEEKQKTGTVNIIEGANKANFIIQVGKERKFFSRDDFRGVVKAAQSGNDIKALSIQIFNYLMRERKDFLIDINIQKNNDPRLAELINLIKSKYKVKS